MKIITDEPITGTLLTDGLTIRGLLSAISLQGLIASNDNCGMASAFLPISEQAKIAVEYADALIGELNK